MAVLVGLVVVLFAPLAWGKVFVPGDFLYFVYPWKGVYQEPYRNLDLFDVPAAFYPQDVLLNERLKEGDLPLWNPRIFSGHPAVATGQSAFLYPPRLVAQRWLGPATARTVTQLVHMLAMGVIFFWWMRRRGLGAPACGVGAAVWMLNGYVASWMQFEHVLVIGTYLPLMMLCADEAVRSGRWAWWGAMGVGGALCLLGGHLQFSLYAGPLAGAYALVRGRARPGFTLPGLALAGTAAVALASPMLLPFLEFQGMGQRPQFSWETLQRLSAPFWTFLPTLLSPDIFGNPASGFMLNRNPANLIYPEFACYLGVVPLLLAFVALRRSREARVWGAAALACLLAAAATPFYYPVVALLEPLSKLVPLRILFVFAFCGAVLAALGAQAVVDSPEDKRLLGRLGAVTAALWLVVTLGIAWLLTAGRDQLRAWIAPYLSPGYIKLPPFEDSPQFADTVLDVARSTYLHSPHLYWPVILGGFLFWRCRGDRKLVGLLLVVLTGLDLLTFAVRFNPPLEREKLFPPTPGIEYLQAQPGLFRLEKKNLAFYNTLTPYGLQLLTGYESIFPDRYAALLAAVDPGTRRAMRSTALAEFDSPILDGLNLRYLLTLPWEKLDSPRWREVYAGEDMRIYENPQATERAYVVGAVESFPGPAPALRWLQSPAYRAGLSAAVEGTLPGPVSPDAVASPVTMKLYEPDRVVLHVGMRAPGLLVLADSWHPGWAARVDGRPVPIYPTNLAVRGVYLPEGGHLVEFEFEPSTLRAGLRWAGGAAVVLVLLTLAELLLRRSEGGEREHVKSQSGEIE